MNQRPLRAKKKIKAANIPYRVPRDAQLPARTDVTGSVVRLVDQDRSMWSRELIAEGHDIVRACLRRDRPGQYQLQAAINAVHTDAPTAADTDWRQIVQHYHLFHAARADILDRLKTRRSR